MTLPATEQTEEIVTIAVEPSDSPVQRTRSFFLGIACNLRGGLRVACFRHVDARSFVATVEQLVALAVIDLLLTCLADMVSAGLDGHFNFDGLPRALFYLLPLLLAAFSVARREHDASLTVLIAVAVLAAAQYLTVVNTALALALEHGWFDISESTGYLAYYWGPLLWWMLASAFAVVCLARRSWLTRAIHAAVVLAALALPLWLAPASTEPLWIANSHDESDPLRQARYYAVASEDAFYRQPEILRNSLAALQPANPGVANVYFVGVAGYAAEDVFQKELAVVSEVFDRRFGTAGRSISLINNPGTALQAPIASVTSLQRTLAHVGRLMNRDEDVLVLYLTSHGSEDHRFALEFWPLRLHDLDAPTLRKMLDDAGIRWRILVVSACYSGGFIEPLKDRHTLIVTAADAQHTSFGCGAQSDLTYFGKAYVDQALRSSYSLTDAFATARTSIEARERSEGRTPSNPQMYLGPQMAEKLKRLEEQWKKGGT